MRSSRTTSPLAPASRVRRSLMPLAVLALGAVPSACAGAASEGASGAAAAEWRLDAAPRIDVGDREDGDSVVFGRVLDARLLPNGLLAVADGGAYAVRFFDAAGKLVRSVGRRGRGPAEFNGNMQLMDGVGDSLAVWDAGQARWTIVSSTTGGSRQPSEERPVPVWTHAGMEVRSALAAPPAWTIARLSSLAAAQPSPLVAHLDETGVLWVRSEPATGEWRAYVDTSGSVGSLALPANARLLHISRDAIVAVVSDSLGLERVVVHGLTRGPHQEPARTPVAIAPVDSGARRQLMSAMRYAVVAQEAHFAEYGAYTAAGDSLRLEMPEGTAFKLIEVTNRGWRGVGYFTANGFTCGMIIGLTAPAGWSEGEVRCGW